jgi:hypothetical protein
MTQPTEKPLVVKDVEEELLKERKFNRKSGQAIYPLEYTTDLVNLQVLFHFSCDALT